MRRIFTWEAVSALACAPLCFVPVLRWPAGLLLVGLLPGLAAARRLLGERDPLRCLVLGSVLSLALVPALAIPVALLAGRASLPLAILSALALTLVASLAPQRRTGAGPAALPWRAFAVIAGLCVVLQIWMTLQIFPAPDTIRWRGTPDLIFFKGIYSQILAQVPPLDPENGRELLVHNWIYHFDFALIGSAMGLGPSAAQRVASAWMAVTLLGLLYMLGAEVLRARRGALLACLFLMGSGEIYGVARSLLKGELSLESMGWAHSPMGVTMLMGWYNLAPLVSAMAAWYAFERSRASEDQAWLGFSVALCAVTAFFHPVFYGVFMIAFCLWLAALWLRGERRLSWAAYLLTPLPFFLLYKLPYYGWSMPPQVVHPDLSPGGLFDRAQNLALRFGILIPPALLALRLAPHGLLATLVVTNSALWLGVRSPNPHWFGDLLHVALALAAGAALGRLSERRPGPAWAAAGAALALSALGLALGVRTALEAGHSFSADERATAAWLEEATQPSDLVAIRPNSRSSYAVIGLAGRRVIHGWTTHLLDFKADALQQEAEVESIFATGDPEAAAATARKLGAALVWVGPDERAIVPEGRLPDRCFRLRHGSAEIEVYEPAC